MKKTLYTQQNIKCHLLVGVDRTEEKESKI
jgi:hypothetical protein